MEETFLDIHKNSMEVLGFWTETYKKILIKTAESMYVAEIIREWCISDIVFNGDKVLLKWNKRYRLLTDEELKDQYGK